MRDVADDAVLPSLPGDRSGAGTSTSDEEPLEPVRQVWHFGLLALVGLAVMASLVLSARPPTLASMYNVVFRAPLPRTEMGRWRAYSVWVPKTDWRPEVAVAIGRTGEVEPPRLGYLVRQWTFLGLPLVATRKSDLLVIKENARQYSLGGMFEEEEQALVGQPDGKPGFGLFPFWRFCWGWLAVAAVAMFAWAELAWQARRRALLGIM